MGRFWQIAISAAMACSGSISLAADTAGTPIGKKIENFSLPDYPRQGPLAGSDYKDKLVVLAFIGTECPLAKTYAPAAEEPGRRVREAGRRVPGH